MDSIRFTLYVAGETTRSQRAISNLKRLAETRLAGRYELDIVDVTEDPDAAEAGRILTTPTLVKEYPLPTRRVTGDLSDAERVLFGLALEAALTGETDTEIPT